MEKASRDGIVRRTMWQGGRPFHYGRINWSLESSKLPDCPDVKYSFSNGHLALTNCSELVDTDTS